MHNAPATEWLLARLTTPTRAAAIMGDLDELAATRARLWFWIAYTRTLISLGWRTPVAFLCAYACTRSYWLLTAMHTSMNWLLHSVHLAGPAEGMPLEMRLLPMMGPLFGLYFLAPFVLVRFGPRDRVARLGLALFLATVPAYSNRLVGLSLAEALAAITVLLALCLREWRRPMTVLALALVSSFAILEGANLFLRDSNGSVIWHHNQYLAIALLQFAASATVCSFLHRRMLERYTAMNRVQIAGASDV